MAARTDSAHAAAHQICMQLWLASSLLADALAVAAQTIMARNLSAHNKRAIHPHRLTLSRQRKTLCEVWEVPAGGLGRTWGKKRGVAGASTAVLMKGALRRHPRLGLQAGGAICGCTGYKPRSRLGDHDGDAAGCLVTGSSTALLGGRRRAVCSCRRISLVRVSLVIQATAIRKRPKHAGVSRTALHS